MVWVSQRRERRNGPNGHGQPFPTAGQIHGHPLRVTLFGATIIFSSVKVIKSSRVNLPFLGFRFELRNDFCGIRSDFCDIRNGFWALKMGFLCWVL
jgi:hypothetical protein